MMEVVVTTGAIGRAMLQSNHHNQQTNTQLFYRPDALPVAQPTVSNEKYHSMDLLTPSSPGGLPTLSLTTNISWLPWGRFAMPLISPLMPVPLVTASKLIVVFVVQPKPVKDLTVICHGANPPMVSYESEYEKKTLHFKISATCGSHYVVIVVFAKVKSKLFHN